jgi:hypothetical protein
MQVGNLGIAAAATLVLVAGQAGAATVTVCGPTICYEYDDAQAGTAKFGLPTLVGDALQFVPSDFRAESANGDGFAIDSATFVLNRVYSLSGAAILGVSAFESGDYRIISGGSVDVDLFLQAASNVTALDIAIDTANFAAAGDSAGLQQWDLTATVSPAATFSGLSNDMAVTVQNTLLAFTGSSGELAWIQKKLILEVAVVPLPAAAWLFASALGLVGWVRRCARIQRSRAT